ncbi:TrkH family potassium uptake protein [Sinomonas sp. R1AF57]|uniref:TrkH family potassium uptake protein n=1 Tax=Sinomonas sp. R1AF57 TaxID=2020377 RepID=UPI000B5F8A63|nr:potassium transporter TrkG [Sinomonas sp. R1AF57]ASN51045.1 ATPase [Sinomonas sp. R1AF57]
MEKSIPAHRPRPPGGKDDIRRTRDGRLRRLLLHPVRSVPVAFLGVILAGTGLLLLPLARTNPTDGAVLPALFTSVSAVCVTGLATVDTPGFWTPFGHAVIMALIQVGGLGIMALATLLALMVCRNLGLRRQLVAQSETRTLNLGDVRTVLFRIARTTALIESLTAAVLAVRLWAGYGYSPGEAVWYGAFHAVSAFNNAGFALYSDSLVQFAHDPYIILPVCTAVIAGGLGFPVLIELGRRTRPRAWSTHTRLTVWGSLTLLVIGTAAFAGLEWDRAETLGGMDSPARLLASVAGGVFPRTAGFNATDYASLSPETLLVTDVLMFIGGGSAGTAGGIKVSTFLVLAFAMWNEIRGHEQVAIGPRSISSPAQRQALTVALLSIAAVILGTLVLLRTTGHSLEQALFEAVSAFATVGLSTGITPTLPPLAQATLIALMFIGRLGPITTATALALSSRPRLYRLPEDRPIIG